MSFTKDDSSTLLKVLEVTCGLTATPGLLPCPFCGNDAISLQQKVSKDPLHIPVLFYCFCLLCGAKVGLHSEKERAIKHWNKRKG